MDIRRFGPGHRRPDGPPGTHGVTGRVIHQDARGSIAEMAFGLRASVAPHTNPNTIYFVVISGGGVAQVGAERAPVSHGEAVVWPAGELHAAWTEGTEMRAIVIEFTGEEASRSREIMAGTAEPLPPGPRATRPAERGRGGLAPWGGPDPDSPSDRDLSSGEPW